MKTYTICFFVILFAISCNKYDGPSRETTRSYSFQKEGDNQKTFAGSYFPDSIKIRSYGTEYGISSGNMKATFTVVSGGGSVDDPITDITNGYAKTRWKSGSSGSIQKLKIQFYNSKNEYLNTIYYDGYAFQKGVWDSVKTSPDTYISDIIADTIAKRTLMITGQGLFTTKSDYYNWQQIALQQISPFSLHYDNKGSIYISTWQGQIVKSSNGSNFWNYCTSPIPGHPYYYYMTISNDGYIWTSTPQYEKSLRCSRDGGISWSADTVGLLKTDLVGEIFRLSNGDILFHSSSNLRLYKSTDDGKSWKSMPSPSYSTKLYVTAKDEIIIYNQENGMSIHKSTDLGKTFKKVYNVMPSYGTTAMSRIIVKKGNYYYCLIAGYGIIRTNDFESFETFWLNKSIVYLYLTYEGVLITKGLNNNVTYYYRD